jgi:hypothetical protein
MLISRQFVTANAFNSRLGRLEGGLIKHLGGSFSDSLEPWVSVAAEKARLQTRSELFSFLNFRFGI